MDSAHPVRDAIVWLELLFVCHAAFLRRIPLLRLMYRTVTAEPRILASPDRLATEICIDFHSPYFHLPVSVDKSQIGQVDSCQLLKPAAFRLFEWQTWVHINGNVEWHGERHVHNKEQQLDFVTGFSYRISELPEGGGNLGLRLAEGVEGEVRIACGKTISRVSFEPVFWLLEATDHGFRPVPIKTNKLTGLIVSLFDMGSGNPTVMGKAVADLCQWAEYNIGHEKPFTGTRKLLVNIRDWGPLEMEPLYQGIKEVFKLLEVADLERELFDFVADNWGIRNNRNGRILAVKLLAALNTNQAKAALHAVYELVRFGGIDEEELELIRMSLGQEMFGPSA